MKVKQLIEQLQNLNSETAVKVLKANPNKGYSGLLHPIENITTVIDQDTNKGFYVLEIIEKNE